jgi:hypothetical protein
MSNDHEWLNLVEVSGPFLAVPVLKDVFPQGLEALSSGHPQRLRRTYEEWREAVDIQDVDLTELHAAWVKEVLSTALEIDEAVLRSGDDLPASLTIMMPEHGTTITPDLAVVNPTNADEPLLLIHVYAPDTNLEATHRFDGLAITPADRMVSLLRATGCPIGLVTNGERWMLVHAPVGAVAGFASWYARLWGQEPETLRAFVSLLGVRRSFGPDDGRLAALYERSLKHQDDVTEALGEQVRRAVEVLVQSLDRANQDRNQELLRDVDPRELYEASLTVMMRLVFLLAAEERGLLLLGDPRYDSFYAISSLRMQLRSDSEEILERRRSAWSRLLGLFRGVFGGIEHPTLGLPALGGSLFDPDRYPFLEGRKKGTFWRTDPAEPLPIDDRTVLLLLEAIQTFQGRALSYRALDVEQIGHVYEGLLERTVKRVGDVTLELDGGSKAKSPRITLGEMESARLDDTTRVVELIKERSERSESAIRNALERQVDDRLAARLLTVCRGDSALRDRILPLANLLRTDPWGYPLIHHKGAFVVVLGADRRESGTHYTPKSMTEKIVDETLTPVAYRGPAEGKPPEEWELKSAEDLLDLKICDPAMGSGAFLVQACRWLSDRLIEAWSITEASGKSIDSEGQICADGSSEGFDPLSPDAEERAVVARRLVAERCLYGVDKNPLAVELAKLSLWLTTMSKGRPFGFLDHNLRSGDSLLGIHDIRQLTELSMTPKGSKQLRLFGRSIRDAVQKAIELRMRLRSIPIRDIGDVEAMAALDAESCKELLLPHVVADAFIGIIIAEPRATERADRLQALEALADAAANGSAPAVDRLHRDAHADLRIDAPDGLSRTPFHWPLEFPEVFAKESDGFHAIIGNPPFSGGRQLTSQLGNRYYQWLNFVRNGVKGSPDLVVFFFLRAASLSEKGSCLGLIATSTISDTGNRVVGLDQLHSKGFSIFSAAPKIPWPGAATVEVSIVIFRNGSWSGQRLLGNRRVDAISTALTSEPTINPKPLMSLKNLRSDGFKFMGEGFVLTKQEADEIIENEPESRDILFPYFTGEDLSGLPTTLTPKEFAIDFEDRSEQEAQGFPLVYARIKEIVKPIRDAQSGQIHQHCFWKYWDMRPRLREHQASGRYYLVAPSTAKYVFFRRYIGKGIFSQKVKTIFLDNYSDFACLQSSIHNEWVRATSGSRGAASVEYSLGKSFGTFPFPRSDKESLQEIGETYYAAREQALAKLNVGPTEFYNRLHNAEDTNQLIVKARALQEQLDVAVSKAYAWDDIQLGHGFHKVPYLPESDNQRFSISDAARTSILKRLAELNERRHDEETEDLPAKKTSNSTRATRTRLRHISGQSELGLGTPPQNVAGATAGLNSAAEKIVSYLRARKSWMSKSDIVAHIEIPDGQWNAAINDLLSRGTVERQGERRGARYKFSESD